ncbi:MAG: 3-isopropylmalate dehydratase [Myxococcales bacterium]|nr:3-isopropylmalate dehydratase [Myxococcales bacterium]
MAQKILAARSGGPSVEMTRRAGEIVEVEVDQIALARAPTRAFHEALAAGMKKTSAEVAVAYDGRCTTLRPAGGAPAPAPEDDGWGDDPPGTSAEMLARGVLVARAGVGFPGPVHLERFASPARLCVTDEPRLAGVGGIGMLTLVVPTHSLAHALAHGTVSVRFPVSVQVSLSGRLRPFVCARDVALELLRRGLAETVRRVEEERGAPVVVEFTGPSARSLSVGERSVLAAIAPQVGAAAAVFVSDERTEVFLRDQRRSKAHRALAPDAGAPCEEVVPIDLGAVDPLLLDEHGQVRTVRDLAGRPVTQVLLGGDGGATLRDFFAAATLLKSKRVPPRLDFLVAVSSRQMLEVLAGAGALTDLIATGARLVEPDARIAWGALYPPARVGASLRTCDPEPRLARQRGQGRALVASAETLAFAVATGVVGDPRAFKRPVRVTVPRALPTDDVLVSRKGERNGAAQDGQARRLDRAVAAWRAAQVLDLVDSAALADVAPSPAKGPGGGIAVVCATLDEVRDLATRAPDVASAVRAVLAPYIPSALVALLSAAGIAALRIDAAAAKSLQGQKTIALPAPAQWAERQATTVNVGAAKLPLTWLALGAERAWATGAARPSAAAAAPTRAAR